MKMMPALLGCILAVPGLARGQEAAPKAAQPASAARAQQSEGESRRPQDEAAIRKAFATFVQSYNERSAEGLGKLFTEDAALVDTDGAATRGRSSIAEQFAYGFEEGGEVKLESTIDSIRFIAGDVAQIEGISKLSAGEAPAEATRFSVLLARQDGAWKIAEIRDTPAPAADITPYERLKELEWMVGEWVDESENSTIRSKIVWADNKSYLVRTYSIEIPQEKPTTGTMWIGWDPQASQIKSWVFDSHGGHGEGYWTRASENQWVVKARGTLHDGRPSSATQIHTVLNKDAVKTSSIDRIIGGEIAPDIADVVMVRKPPQPTNAQAAPATAAPATPKSEK